MVRIALVVIRTISINTLFNRVNTSCTNLYLRRKKMADNTDWMNVYNQTTANWIAMRDSEYRHDIDEKTLAQK